MTHWSAPMTHCV